jgi:2-polyprenyl-3-methyl-5-hydroxy-6-metoxy-1,4-benzoquinol methylase
MHSPRTQRNPHFDDQRIVWDDAFAGVYQPVAYDQQFDRQWQLFMEQSTGFTRHAGAETRDPWVDERIRELTGVDGFIERRKHGVIGYRLRKWLRREKRMGLGSKLTLQPPFPVDYFQGKRCLDVGCGAGRWTKALMTLGAAVKSTDTSPHGLRSVRAFNDDVEELDLFELMGRRDLHAAFDFAICWGVMMHVHDPKLAFENVASTVAPGGELYTMIYSPEGMHNTPEVWRLRTHYHTQLKSAEEKVEYARQLSSASGNALGHLDMLNTFYNWVVPETVIHEWYRTQGFSEVVTLNAAESPKCAFHVLGRKSIAAGSTTRSSAA